MELDAPSMLPSLNDEEISIVMMVLLVGNDRLLSDFDQERLLTCPPQPTIRDGFVGFIFLE